MLTINLSKPVGIYDNINEMPISRYSDFQRGLMIDANIGSTIQDFDKLFNQSVKFIDGKKYKEAMQFLLNVRTGIYLAQQGQIPTNYAFASLVKSIDGVRITDYSEDGLSKILEELDKLGLPQAKLNEVLEDVKKKSSMI